MAERRDPMNADDFVRLDNHTAKKKPPRALLKRVEPRIFIHSPEDKAPRLKAAEIDGAGRAWTLTPPTVGIGLPGRALDRSTPKKLAAELKRAEDAQREVSAFMPEWVEFAPHAKLAGSGLPIMRRVGGKPIVPHKVFGADDRVVYYPGGYPWHCIGKVLVWSNASTTQPQWSGSAVLTGDRTILTCGHMVPWGSTNWKMQFIPAFYDGASTLGAGAASWVSDCHGYDTNDKVSAWDMAVCRLYEPLGQMYGYFGTKDYHSSWEGGPYWTLAGYPGAVANGNRPSRQMWWAVDDDDQDGSAEEVEYRADSSGGNSGGPVFGFWGGQPYCIATHSGGSKTKFLWWTIEDTNVGAGGGALNSLVAWARSAWPA